jgi:CopG family nickel-responsive transcriptional regulator
MVLYDNHTYSQDDTSIHIQHRYTDIITTTTHMHLDPDNCLETIMVRGETKRIKELANHMSKNRGIKSFKVNFVSVV